MSPNSQNPFKSVTLDDLKQHSGKLVALSLEGEGILCAAENREQLSLEMERIFPDTRYVRLSALVEDGI